MSAYESVQDCVSAHVGKRWRRWMMALSMFFARHTEAFMLGQARRDAAWETERLAGIEEIRAEVERDGERARHNVWADTAAPRGIC